MENQHNYQELLKGLAKDTAVMKMVVSATAIATMPQIALPSPIPIFPNRRRCSLANFNPWPISTDPNLKAGV